MDRAGDMAQSAGESRSTPTRNSDSVLGEGEFTAHHVYFLLETFICFWFFYSNEVTFFSFIPCTPSRFWGNL